ncbi:LysR family transcriptional regulator [Tardiphaga alba]|uniref:LysR family transcriptional regulator n=1 Tax=Tardiphaga alba TaxID=340268 RepID=A0ABX8AFH7_9BRAD|nr:LysR family transcriptional regulator [Tardiphaga alba]QUS41374.1 LysR family transcriptional regulator [Tardiphaga alba]
MPSQPHRLPPFAALVAFDAVLRHGSMTLAAAELGLTQSAISHRLRDLERYFGLTLFERLNPGLRVTDAGHRLSHELTPLLGTLSGLRRHVRGRPQVRPFRIGTGSALLNWWLSPRLPALAAAFPDLAIEVMTWDPAAPRGDVDLGLVWIPREASTEGPCEVRFPDEFVFPIVSPKLLKCHGPHDEWSALPLLAKGHRGEDMGPEWSWTTWLGPNSTRPEAMRFRDISGTLQAAVDGNGVALGRSLLVADALRRRRLKRLGRRSEARLCSKVQIARWRDPTDHDAARMAAWLVANAAS